MLNKNPFFVLAVLICRHLASFYNMIIMMCDHNTFVFTVVNITLYGVTCELFLIKFIVITTRSGCLSLEFLLLLVLWFTLSISLRLIRLFKKKKKSLACKHIINRHVTVINQCLRYSPVNSLISGCTSGFFPQDGSRRRHFPSWSPQAAL